MSNTPMLCCWVGVIIWRGTFICDFQRACICCHSYRSPIKIKTISLVIFSLALLYMPPRQMTFFILFRP